jgi:hypothetical protein
VENEIFVALAIDLKKVAERQLAFAVVDGQRANLSMGEPGDDVGRDHLRLQRDGRLALEVEGDGHLK